MYWLTELYISLRDFMEQGGPVLWYIAFLVTFMWALIFERVYYFLFVHDDFAQNIRSNPHGTKTKPKLDSYLKEKYQLIEMFNSYRYVLHYVHFLD